MSFGYYCGLVLAYVMALAIYDLLWMLFMREEDEDEDDDACC